MPSARQSTPFSTFGEKTFSDHRRKKLSPSLSPLSFRLSMISCLTDGWDGKDDGAMVNVVDKLAQKPASPLVSSRHMKLSLDDLKALQEHIKAEGSQKITRGNATISLLISINIISTCIPSLPQNAPSQQAMLSDSEKWRQDVFLAAASRAKHGHIDRRLPLYRHCCQVRATLALPHLCWHLWSYIWVSLCRARKMAV